MKRLYALFVLVLLVSCGGGGGSDIPPPRIAIYGDSIMFGYDLPVSPIARIREARPTWVLDERYAGSLQLQQIVDGYKEPFDNAPAWTYPAGPQRPFVEETRLANVVPIQAGVNDVFHNSSRCEQNMRLVITTVLKEGRTPVLTGIVGLELDTFPPFVGEAWHRCNTAFHVLAKEFGLQHAGWDTDYRGPQDIRPDRVHRTQEASDRLTVLLIQAIDRATN